MNNLFPLAVVTLDFDFGRIKLNSNIMSKEGSETK